MQETEAKNQSATPNQMLALSAIALIVGVFLLIFSASVFQQAVVEGTLTFVLGICLCAVSIVKTIEAIKS